MTANIILQSPFSNQKTIYLFATTIFLWSEKRGFQKYENRH